MEKVAVDGARILASQTAAGNSVSLNSLLPLRTKVLQRVLPGYAGLRLQAFQGLTSFFAQGFELQAYPCRLTIQTFPKPL